MTGADHLAKNAEGLMGIMRVKRLGIGTWYPDVRAQRLGEKFGGCLGCPGVVVFEVDRIRVALALSHRCRVACAELAVAVAVARRAVIALGVP